MILRTKFINDVDSLYNDWLKSLELKKGYKPSDIKLAEWFGSEVHSIVKTLLEEKYDS